MDTLYIKKYIKDKSEIINKIKIFEKIKYKDYTFVVIKREGHGDIYIHSNVPRLVYDIEILNSLKINMRNFLKMKHDQERIKKILYIKLNLPECIINKIFSYSYDNEIEQYTDAINTYNIYLECT